jgi:hypothetical protein
LMSKIKTIIYHLHIHQQFYLISFFFCF